MAPTGHLEADLLAAMDAFVTRLNIRPARAFFGACLEFGRRSDEDSHIAERCVDGILEPFRVAIVEGVSSGRLHGEPNELTHELAGPIVLEHIVLGREISRADGRRRVDRFLEAHPRSPGGGDE